MKTINDSNYGGEIPSNGLVIIDFYAEWCGPCKVLTPTLEKLSEINKNVTFLKVNVDESPEYSSANNIRSVPTMVFIKDGVVVDRLSGNHSEVSIQNKINTL